MIQLEDIKRLTLKKDETLVIQLPMELDDAKFPELAINVERYLREMYPDQKLLILDKSTQLSVIKSA